MGTIAPAARTTFPRPRRRLYICPTPRTDVQEISMRIGVKQLAVVSLAAILLAAGGIGCDDTHSADRRVRETIAASRMKRLGGDATAAQELLDKAAGETGASPSSRAYAKALLGRA